MATVTPFGKRVGKHIEKYPLQYAIGTLAGIVVLAIVIAFAAIAVFGSSSSTSTGTWHTFSTSHATVSSTGGPRQFDILVQYVGKPTNDYRVTKSTGPNGRLQIVVHARQPRLRVVVVPSPGQEAAGLLQPQIAVAKTQAISNINTDLTLKLKHQFGKQSFLLSYDAK